MAMFFKAKKMINKNSCFCFFEWYYR